MQPIVNAVSKKELAAIYAKKSNVRGSFALLCNWVLFLTFSFISTKFIETPPNVWSILGYILLSFIVGCTLRGFDNLTHEASHRNLFTNKEFHSLLEFLYCYPVLKTLSEYWQSHRLHHKHYRDEASESDPDRKQIIRWGVEDITTGTSRKKILWFYVLRLLILYYAVDNIRYNIIPHIRSKESVKGKLLFWGIIFFLIAITHSWNYFLWGYVIPYVFWLPYIRFVTESSKHSNVNLHNELSSARSNLGITHQILLHPWNDGYHQMHHYIASIPFYNLGKAYRHLKQGEGVDERVIESKSFFQTINQIFKRA